MLLRKLTYGNQYCAVEHAIENGQGCYHLLQLSYRKNSLETVFSASFSDFKKLISSIPKEQHVFLIINNNKVLSKNLESSNDLENGVKLAFPNINSSDFTIEMHTNTNQSFISICRNNDVQSILVRYKKNGIQILGFSIGNTQISNVIPYVNQQTIYTSNSRVDLKDSVISTITKVNEIPVENYNLNDLIISSKNLLSFSGILKVISNSEQTISNFENQLYQLKEDFKQKRLFSNSLKFGLGLLFGLLLVNFLVFSNYRTKINALSNEQQVNENYKENLLQLNKNIERKRNVVKDITSVSSSKISFYLDEIGTSIPNSILLTQLYLQPILKTIKKENEILFSANTIVVKGKSYKSHDFSDWINLLENKKWIEKIAVIEYGVGTNSKTEEFEINLTFVK
ncbi:hypothetical protein [Urechidicola croceus]|uniref:General secretion pathway protein n=1 Tax=Urechidicola croceus TaxID=1850246 RepID=A0A1D8P867_9FLAO|nr:hypothetical protein [Urechidicola croceus]AOW20763.1 hypothetical protein LPB138_08775 [Urechidicola croceus]